ncbi:MAG: SRPBCC family protein [Solirubrobacterales bacterium]|nr:SRPBCC family protein [Solirubrobacterales bacterium]
MQVKETIEIARSPDEVWVFVADHANDPRWCRKVKSVESAGARRWQVRHKPFPLRPPVTLLVEQLELDPPRRLKLREEDRASVFEVEYRLEGTERGTSFTQISDFERKTLPRFLRKGFARGVQRDVRHQLHALKHMLEAR